MQLEWLRRDLSAAIRSHLRRPGVAIVAVVTLTLGIGANVTALAVSYVVLGRPLPYANPSRLAIFDVLFADGTPLGFSPRVAAEWLRRLETVEAAAAYSRRDVTVRAPSQTTVVSTALVTPGFFAVFGVPAATGTANVDADDGRIVISRSAFALFGPEMQSSTAATVSVGDNSYTIAGVMPADFTFPDEQVSLWLPSRVQTLGYSRIVARLKPGVTLLQARQDAERVRHDLNSKGGEIVAVGSLGEARVGRVRRLLVASVVGSLFVLLVACANVATLLLGRDLARQRELATRAALGATRVQLFRFVIVDTLCLATVASLAGLAVGIVALKLYTSQAAAILPGLNNLGWPVAVATVVLTPIVTLACGALPAVRAVRLGAGALLHASVSAPASSRARDALVIVQIALCAVLLVGAGLLMRTVLTLMKEDHGFDPGVATEAKIVLRDTPFPIDKSSRDAIVPALLERVRGLPGVTYAGFGTSLPPRLPLLSISVSVHAGAGEDTRMMNIAWATPGYLPALGARFLAGRDFENRDATDETPGVILSQSAARSLFPGQDPLGRAIPRLPANLRAAPDSRVSGVVRDIKYDGLDSPPGSTIYLPWGRRPLGRGYVIVRGDRAASGLATHLRLLSRQLDPTVPVAEVRSLGDVLTESLAERKIRAVPAILFGVLGLAVSLAGLLATLSMFVAARQREMAIRTALGATAATLFASVVGRGLVLTAVGLVTGLAFAVAVTGTLASLLYHVSPYDPLSFAGTALLVGAGAMLASCVAAWSTRTIERRLDILKQ